MRRLVPFPLLLAATLAACTPAAVVSPTAPTPPPAATELPGAIRWVRSAAEHRALFLQTYRNAGDRLRAVADTLPAGAWAVILDADETVLDNSTYQKRRAELGLGFTPETWNDWVREGAAPALPGAVAFTRLVAELGGRVVIVTNRAAVVCAETEANLARVGVPADAVLCQTGPSEKNTRFQSVQSGGVPGLPALRVAMWVGDNIQDFPALTQEVRLGGDAGFGSFGEVYWMLPNPMYGSWERNPVP